MRVFIAWVPSSGCEVYPAIRLRASQIVQQPGRGSTDLAESRAALGSLKPAEELSRERLHQLRDLMIHVRKRKLKPEKGRRKDLRKIDSLIEDLQLLVPNKNQG
jgi:hypothetical protein